MANKLCLYYDYKGIDFDKFLNHFEKGLVQELDFKTEVINSQKTVDNFRYVGESDDLYIPTVDVLKSTKRTILMEYVEGIKIDDIEGLDKKFGSAKNCTNMLIKIFAKMIFLHGHVHCDAHPGNIFVRENPKRPGRPQIVLLDHGFYGTTSHTFRKQFCKLWYALATMDYSTVKRISYEMGIDEYYRYLPILFTYRTINATKPLGAKGTKEEKDFLLENNEGNLEKIGTLLQKLPTDVVFIFKAMHMIGLHNFRAGGSSRDRILTFSDFCIQAMSERFSYPYLFYLRMHFRAKVFLFENWFWLYERMYGFMRVSFDKDKLIDNLTDGQKHANY